MKKFLFIINLIIIFIFLGCGNSSDNGKEVLTHNLKLIGIPPEIVVNVCQDNNDNGSCDIGELQAKIIVNKTDSITEIWEKVQFDEKGRYILENYDPTKNIIMEIEDRENLKYDNHKLGLRYNADTEELSILQAIIDADFLEEKDTNILKESKFRNSIDKILLDSLRINQNLLKEEKLSQENALSLNLEKIAKGLIKLDIAKELPEQLNACNGNKECIDNLTNNAKKEVELTPEEAKELAQSKKIVDGYILKLATPVVATCSNGKKYNSSLNVDKEGRINFSQLPLDIDCNLTVPRGSTIDSNNNGELDTSDVILNFDMIASNNTTHITPLTTLLFKKIVKRENVDKFSKMIQNFNPVTAPNRVLTNSGIEKLKIEKLIILMEVLKTSMKQFIAIENIDLSDIIVTLGDENIQKFNVEKLIARLPKNIQQSIIERANTIKELLKILKDLDTSKISLNTLFVCVSDGGKSISDAIREALLVPLPEGVNPLDFIIKVKTSVIEHQPVSTPEDIKNTLETINTPPIAKIGEDKNILFGETITIDGSKSLDPDGIIVSYRWIIDEKIVGTETSFIVKDLEEGEYTLSLIVQDNKGAINSDKLVIIVNPLPNNNNLKPIENKKPIANAGVNQIVEEGTIVHLNASKSYDLDGEIISYQWLEKDKLIGNDKELSYNFNAGEHLITLIVKDNNGSTAQDKVNIRVYTPSNTTVPNHVEAQVIANAGQDQTVQQKQYITLNAVNSVGNIIHYSWTENGYLLSENQSFTRNDFSIGIHHIMLTVLSNNNKISTDMVTINILNILPTPIIKVSETNITLGETINFDASNSYDTYGNIVEYEWSDGDNILSNDINFSDNNLSIGEHTITLTVTDDYHATRSNSININVNSLTQGSIIGVIRDFNTGNNLKDINITLRTTESEFIKNSLSDENGTYFFNNLNTDINYSISFEKDGYMLVLYELIQLEKNEVKNLEAIKLLVENNTSEDINQTFSGKIIDAISGNPLDDVNISIRENIQNQTGSILAQTVTDITGIYSVALPYGIYTVEAQKEGFSTLYFTITVINNEDNQTSIIQESSLSPYVKEDEIRIILRWGATPSDLDSHLVKKTDGIEDYHIYFENKLGDDANLDHDDTTSYGPETTTINSPKLNSVYTYFVHNFSGGSLSELKNSGAQIEIISNSTNRIFNVPNEDGIYWKVFEIINGEIISCNENCVQDIQNENILQKISETYSNPSELFKELASK